MRCKLSQILLSYPSSHACTFLGLKNIRRQEGIERRTGNVRVVTTAITTAVVEEVIVAVNIPEVIQELDGLMNPMECNHLRVHL